ncbi:MAG: 30S ribosomal protein S6 [Kiritimatiellales bacterium]|nr:30S ribosomal protein S6 [Kiritimatiellales bacterium]
MKTLYEGLFIFPEILDDAQLDQALEAVKVELEKLDGTLESSTRLGKRTFARPMKKKKGGIYVVIMFRLDGGQIDALKRRLKLATNVFRAQFMQKDEAVVAQEA